MKLINDEFKGNGNSTKYEKDDKVKKDVKRGNLMNDAKKMKLLKLL